MHCFRPQRLETWPNLRPKGIKSQPGTKILSDRSEGERRKKHRPARVGTTREASLTDTKSCPVQTASQYNVNTYPICDYPLWKSAQKQKLRRNHHFYVWIEDLTNSKPLECEDSFTNQQHSNFLLYCRQQWCEAATPQSLKNSRKSCGNQALARRKEKHWQLLIGSLGNYDDGRKSFTEKMPSCSFKLYMFIAFI